MSRFLEPVFYKSVRFPAYPHTFASDSPEVLGLSDNSIGDEGVKALAASVAASGSLALKTLYVPSAIIRHAELVAACKSKGVELN